MASGDLIATLTPPALISGAGGGTPQQLVTIGGVWAHPLPEAQANGYQGLVRVPVNGVPLTTGLTVRFHLADDPRGSGSNSKPGTKLTLGVQCKRLISGTSDLSQAGAAAEVVSVTSVPAGMPYFAVDVPVPNASLNGAVAGDLVLIKVRRNDPQGSTRPEAPGTVLLLALSVIDT
jgi:hypothetical protein